MSENERFGLVFAKTGSINSDTRFFPVLQASWVVSLRSMKILWRRCFNYLCAVHNVLDDACISIKRESGRGLGPGI